MREPVGCLPLSSDTRSAPLPLPRALYVLLLLAPCSCQTASIREPFETDRTTQISSCTGVRPIEGCARVREEFGAGSQG